VHIQYVTVREGSGSKGAIILSPGNTEPAEQYDENMRDLVDRGYSPIYCIAHRGQGRSDRLLDDPYKAHVDGPADYTWDFRDFVELVANEKAGSNEDKDKPLFLLCHSMGCAIAFTYLIEEYEAQRPQLFHAVAGYGPLIKADTDPFPYDIAVSIGAVMMALGEGEAYPPTLGKTFEEQYGSATEAEAFKTATTSSLTRWKRDRQYCIELQTSLLSTKLLTCS
jgi:lysophospholipase